jgi:elongation factor G
MDKTGADFYSACRTSSTVSARKPVAIQLPIGAENNFKGVIDLVRMKALVYNQDSLGSMYDVEPIPADLADKAKNIARSWSKPPSNSTTMPWLPISTAPSRTRRP